MLSPMKVVELLLEDVRFCERDPEDLLPRSEGFSVSVSSSSSENLLYVEKCPEICLFE